MVLSEMRVMRLHMFHDDISAVRSLVVTAIDPAVIPVQILCLVTFFVVFLAVVCLQGSLTGMLEV